MKSILIYYNAAATYRATLTKGTHAHSSHFLTLKILNLPPQLRDKKETKALFAILDCDEPIINKFNKIIVQHILKHWKSVRIWDYTIENWDTIEIKLAAMMNDLKVNRNINYLHKAPSKHGACM